MVVCRFIMFIERGQGSDPTRIEEKCEDETLESFIWADESDPEKEMVRDEGKQSPVEEDNTLKELLRVDEQYVPLLTMLEQFSPGEDGIQYNRKLSQFEDKISSMCPDEERLHKAFATLRAAALLNSETARKLAAAGAAFTRQSRQRLRMAILNVVMQETFEKLEVLEKSNPIFLINAANLMGDYFAEAKLGNGKKLNYLSSPLLQYMRALLKSDDIRAHRSLATQLLQNGGELFTELGEEMDELSISIRRRLISPPPTGNIWLLLSADICLNKFLPLPRGLQQFYAACPEGATEENLRDPKYGSWMSFSSKSRSLDTLSNPGKEGSVSEITKKVCRNLSLNSPKRTPERSPTDVERVTHNPALQMPVSDSRRTQLSYKKRLDLNSWRQPYIQEEGERTAMAPSFSNESPPSTKSPRSHVTQVPRSRQYWDHDDRCDRDYNS